MTWHGPINLKGAPGPPGQPGAPGEDAPCIPGPAGAAGPAGSNGAQGPPGVSGEDGSDDGTRIIVVNPSVFGYDGPTHAPGMVPDPGATANPGNPSILGSKGWQPHSGKVLGSSSVTTQESTTSTTFADLTTVQSVSFTLDVAASVVVIANAGYVNTTGGSPIGYVSANVDGSDTVLSSVTPISTSSIHPLCGAFVFALAAGNHTIKQRFKVTGGTGFFSDRNIVVMLKG